MSAALDNAAMIQHYDGVGILDGGKAVGDDKYGAPIHQGVHAPLYNGFRAGVDGGCSLVHNHNRRVSHGRPGNGQQLALALREVCAVACQHGVVTFRQAADKVVRSGQFCCGDTFFVTGIQVAVTDILHNGAGKEVCILQDNP